VHGEDFAARRAVESFAAREERGLRQPGGGEIRSLLRLPFAAVDQRPEIGEAEALVVGAVGVGLDRAVPEPERERGREQRDEPGRTERDGFMAAPDQSFR
jgi:hypothetical protein